MTREDEIWFCLECTKAQGRHAMYFDGACGECHTDKQKAIKRMIIENFMLWYTGELTEYMQCFINEYVEDDHVNELEK